MNKALDTQPEVPDWILWLHWFKKYNSGINELVLEDAHKIDIQILDYIDYIKHLVLINYQDRHLQAYVKYLSWLKSVTIEWWNIVLFPPEFRALWEVEEITITDSPLKKIWPDSIPNNTIKLILDNNPDLVLPFLKKRDKSLELISVVWCNISTDDVKQRISNEITVILK